MLIRRNTTFDSSLRKKRWQCDNSNWMFKERNEVILDLSCIFVRFFCLIHLWICFSNDTSLPFLHGDCFVYLCSFSNDIAINSDYLCFLRIIITMSLSPTKIFHIKVVDYF